MQLNRTEKEQLIRELARELGARKDGSGRNLIAPNCPVCGKGGGKFGIYVGPPTTRRQPFMAHCFSCGHSTSTLEGLLQTIGRMDLMVTATVDLESPVIPLLVLPKDTDEVIDDALEVICLPDFYHRRFRHPYLQSRGFTEEDYEAFPVGDTGRLNRRFTDYVIFPIIDAGDIVGYISRHTWPKADIDNHNRKATRTGEYKILRYRNSMENDFVKLLYNYDAIIEEQIQTVVLCEGVFDVIALTRSLDLYERTDIAAVATFGKKISRIQIYKLQAKGVRRIIIGYDGDAVEAIKRTASELSAYFEVQIADITDPTKDWEDLTKEETEEIFNHHLMTPLEYKLRKVQLT